MNVEKNQTLQFTTSALMFRLFSHFSTVKNPNALFLYRQTVQALVDAHSDVNVRDFFF